MFRISERSAIISLSVLALLLMITLLGGRPQAFTGDEPRYFLYAASIFKHGAFIMPLAEWQQLIGRITGNVPAELPAGSGGVVLLNSVYLSTILSPIAGSLSLNGLRATTTLVGLVGLFHLFKLCKGFAAPGSALISTGIAGLTIPLLPYLHLFYMETFIFTLVCVGWERLQTTTRGFWGDGLTVAVLLIIPFVHMRGSVIAAAMFLLLLWQLRARGLVGRMLVFVALATAAFLILVTLNMAIYGAVTGPINSARPPLPSEWFTVLSMQLFNVRHGLFVFSPVWLLGYIGLGVGSWHRSAVAKQGLILAVIAAITGVGSNPGECWPARFWVLSVPMLAVGFCIWWEAAELRLLRIVTIALLLFTFINSAIFVIGPNPLLENRQTTTTYQLLYDKLGHLHFGLSLPVEVDDAPNLDAARNMALGAGLFMVLIGVSAIKRKAVIAVPAIFIMAAAIDITRVSVVAPSDYKLSRERNGFIVKLHTPTPALYIQFGHNWQAWFAPPVWGRFSVKIVGSEGGEAQEILSANQVISAACRSKVTEITVASQNDFDVDTEVNYHFTLYRSNSFLLQHFGSPRYSC